MGDRVHTVPVEFLIQGAKAGPSAKLPEIEYKCVDPESWLVAHKQPKSSAIKLPKGWTSQNKCEAIDPLRRGVYGNLLCKGAFRVWAVNQSDDVAGGTYEVVYVAHEYESLEALCHDLFPKYRATWEEGGTVKCTC